MEFKGTKENWIMYKTYDEMDTPIFSVNSKEGCIAHVYNLNVCCGIQERTNANALLISKAPEMLEMLKEVIQFLHKVQAPATASIMLGNEINKLIKEATEVM